MRETPVENGSATEVRSGLPAIVQRLGRIRAAWLGVVSLGLLTLYFTTVASSYHIYVYDTFLFACMGAIALQLLQGTAGLISLGNPAFLLIGAFGSVFALKHGIQFPFDVGAGVGIAGVAGLIAGLPALRLRALFLALSTLATFFLAVFVAKQYLARFPGEAETGFFIPTLFRASGVRGQDQRWAWLLFVAVAVIILCASRIMNERSGRAMRMLRQHEFLAPTLGISVPRYKLVLFTITSMVIGLQGGLTAHFVGVVNTSNFTISLAFQYIAMIVIGGLDSIGGAVIGAAIVIGLPVLLPQLLAPIVGTGHASIYAPNVALIAYGVLVAISVTASPDGVVGFLRSVTSRVLSRVEA